MERIRKLKAQRSQLLAQAQEIPNKAVDAKGEPRPLTADELKRVAELKDQIQRIDAELKTLEDMVALERVAPAETVIETPAPAPAPTPRASGRVPEITGGHDRALDDPFRGFPDADNGGLGIFLHSVIQAGRQRTNTPTVNGRPDMRLLPLQIGAAAGADEQSGATQQYGGFTVPVGFTARLLMLEAEDDPTQGVTEIPMAQSTIQIPARVDKNHSSSVAGGITASWRPETLAIPSSRVEMERISLTANSLGALAFVSEELLEDSAISWAALLESAFRDSITDAIIRARISGVGTGRPLGILNSPALISADTTSQTTGTITGANIVAMRQRSWRYSRAIWLANHDCYSQLVQAHLPLTNASVPLFNPARGVDAPDTLLGRPIIFTEYASSLSTVGDIMLVTWSEYLVGNYKGVNMAESLHVRFENNERALRATLRQGGEPWWRSALTPVNSTETLSPYVALATRTT